MLHKGTVGRTTYGDSSDGARFPKVWRLSLSRCLRSLTGTRLIVVACFAFSMGNICACWLRCDDTNPSPVPLTSADARETPPPVDVVLLNWERSRRLQDDVIPMLLQSRGVGRVIVSHGREDTFFEYPNERVVGLQRWGTFNAKYNFAQRFLVGDADPSSAVLTMDDDLLITSAHIENLIDYYYSDPGKVHGYFGRTLTRWGSKVWYTGMVASPAELSPGLFLWSIWLNFVVWWRAEAPNIALTKCMVVPRELLNSFAAIVDDLDDIAHMPGTERVWNGEDIVFGILALKETRSLPVIHTPNPHIWNHLPSCCFGNGSTSWSHGHYNRRQEVSRASVARLLPTMFLGRRK